MEYFILHFLIMICLYIILGLSFNLLLGNAGMFSIAHAAFFGVGAYATGVITRDLGINFFLALPITFVIAGFIGVLLAIPVLRLSDEYLVIATLGFQVIVYSIFMNWERMTGGPEGLAGIPKPEVFGFVFESQWSYFVLSLCFTALCFWIVWCIQESPFGRTLKSIREDEVCSQALGKDIVKMKIIVFMITSALASLSGGLYAGYVTYISPYSFNLHESIFILSIVVVGGIHKIYGPLIGAVVMVVLPELMRFIALPESVAANFRQMIYAGLLVGFMMFRPEGLVGRGRMEEEKE